MAKKQRGMILSRSSGGSASMLERSVWRSLRADLVAYGRAIARRLEEHSGAFAGLRIAMKGTIASVSDCMEAYGQPVRPLYRFSKAEVIVSLDGDFLGPTDPNYVFNTREFTAGRRLDDETGRDVATVRRRERVFGHGRHGGQPASPEGDRSLAFARRLLPNSASAVVPCSQDLCPSAPVMFVREMRMIFVRQAAQAVVVPGESQPAAIHALCAAINQSLGQYRAVEMLATGEPDEREQAVEIQELDRRHARGQVDALLMIGVNPVYSASPDLELCRCAAGRAVHLASGNACRRDRSRTAHWHVPRSHYLEAWGDGRAYDGHGFDHPASHCAAIRGDAIRSRTAEPARFGEERRRIRRRASDLAEPDPRGLSKMGGEAPFTTVSCRQRIFDDGWSRRIGG
jgi:hypothetical protein